MKKPILMQKAKKRNWSLLSRCKIDRFNKLIKIKSQYSQELREIDIIICEDCGQFEHVSRITRIEKSKSICVSCRKINYIHCDICNNWKLKENFKFIENNNLKACSECFQSCWFCNGCNTFHANFVNVYIYENNSVCEKYLNRKRLFICANCGEISNFVNYRKFCEKCCPEKNLQYEIDQIVYPFNFKPQPTFYGCTSKDAIEGRKRVYGFENEVNGNVEIAQELMGISEFIYLKHDGSIKGGGFEIVSHPATIDCLKELSIKKIFYRISKICKSLENPTTGLHVHVNKSCLKNETMSKLLYFFNNDSLEQLLIKMAQRDYTKLHYCSKIEKDHSYLLAQHILINSNSRQENRYSCINFHNKNTVEFRMFKGNTDKYAVIMAVEFVDCLLNYLEQESYQLIKEETKVKENFIEFLKKNANKRILKRLEIN